MNECLPELTGPLSAAVRLQSPVTWTELYAPAEVRQHVLGLVHQGSTYDAQLADMYSVGLTICVAAGGTFPTPLRNVDIHEVSVLDTAALANGKVRVSLELIFSGSVITRFLFRACFELNHQRCS